jgi:outer membrane protein TolC
LGALKEVDNALTAYREAQHQRADVARSVTENQAALQAARQRYSEGAIDFLNVITTQARLLQSENDLSDSDTRIATDLVNLYRALGGGWEVLDVAGDADRALRQRIGIP